MMRTPMAPIRDSSPATSSRSSHHPTVEIKHYRLSAPGLASRAGRPASPARWSGCPRLESRDKPGRNYFYAERPGGDECLIASDMRSLLIAPVVQLENDHFRLVQTHGRRRRLGEQGEGGGQLAKGLAVLGGEQLTACALEGGG